MKPRIGITSWDDVTDPGQGKLCLNSNYVESIVAAGGLPLVLPVTADLGDIAASLDAVDGLLVTGGSDLAPDLYGEADGGHLGSVMRERDLFELALVREAQRKRVPTFGICRGHQVINVALGGSLYQDLGTQLEGALRHSGNAGEHRDSLSHAIEIVDEARLLSRDSFPSDPEGRFLVNSFHHQAIKALAPGLFVTARAPDGVIEAFETREDWWLLGVQFHPEKAVRLHPCFLRLFLPFIAASISPR
ncbi:MAG: gamma-glutamyl-gamma-aminobutyrate hydrolase family protein [Rectinemataceae bacterium]